MCGSDSMLMSHGSVKNTFFSGAVNPQTVQEFLTSITDGTKVMTMDQNDKN
jgi:hypothetical protein